MDSSNPQTTYSNVSPLSSIAYNSSMITFSKRDIFLSTYRRQNFKLRNSMMHYIAKNPKNAKVYQKMIKSCKYFFIKNPILILSRLYYGENEWGTGVNKTWKNIDINRISTKLWITETLYFCRENHSNNSIASSIIPKIYQCDFKYLFLNHQVIFFHEFMFLCSSVEELSLERVIVKNEGGTVVVLEKLIDQLPKVKRFDYTFATLSNNISKNTFKELWKIPHILNYDYFYLKNIPADFDIEKFYTFMKKNKNSRVYLWYSDKISEEYKTRLEAIVDEIIETKNHEYKVPCISFPGRDHEKFFKVLRLYLQ